ncbi:hypothetical protein [Saccharicrinis aurantiacus]|uniref:hypothetical protein n=1 Tax=Saccharicrinis aurantiacus TaxID=1849719 RepID=UPI00111516CE|nr:hypothetical protein [Saccharicrinis aurantiacus]
MEILTKNDLVRLVNEKISTQGIVTTMENDQEISAKKVSEKEFMMLVYSKITQDVAVFAMARYSKEDFFQS